MMYRYSSVLLVLAAILVVGYSLVDDDRSIGLGTKHCGKCGNESTELLAAGLTLPEISRCALLEAGLDSSNHVFKCECRLPSFKGDGINCTNANECLDDSNNCDNMADCIDTVTGFDCKCKDGWEGNGVSCRDFNECKSVTYVEAHNHTHNPCGDSGVCINNVGSYTCICKSGKYVEVEGTNKTKCRDIDECKELNYDCTSAGAHRVCNNIPGSVECICADGFEEIKGECKDINECTRDLDKCDRKLARCENLKGSYHCKCIYGYTGNGTHGNCAVMGGDLYETGQSLKRAQAVIKVHMLENERQQLENEHEMLLRRCDQQDQAQNRIVQRARREVLKVSEAEAANAQLWISTLTSHISDLKLQNHVLELSCPEH